MQAYYEGGVPQPGEEFLFYPKNGLQSVLYVRPRLVDPAAGFVQCEAATAAEEAEKAEALSSWAIAVLARALSLNNIVTVVTGRLSPPWLVFPFHLGFGGILAVPQATYSLLPPPPPHPHTHTPPPPREGVKHLISTVKGCPHVSSEGGVD